MTAINSSDAHSSVSAKLGKSEQLHVKKIREDATVLEPKKARENTISPDATDAVQIAISGQNGGELHTKGLEDTEKKK